MKTASNSCLWIFLVSTAGLWLQHAHAQSKEATCLTNSEWAYNSVNQSVCTVASNLAAVCNVQRVYTIPPLTLPGNVYGGPTKDDDCRCNSVFYSLLSACATCQGYRYISWTAFKTNCTDALVGSYPKDIPQGTAVFDWAYEDVSINNGFDSALAESQPDAPDSTFNPSATSTSLSASPTASESAPPAAGKSSTNAGAIAGGVVGGIAFLAIVTLVILWFVKRRPKSAASGIEAPIMAHSQMTSTTFNNDYSTSQTPVLYNPSDPSTYPKSPVPSSTIYTTYTDGGSGLVQGRPAHGRTFSDGTFSGAPEL